MTTIPPNLTRLMADIRISLPGAIDDAIQQALFSTLNEFFQNTNIWREDIDVPVTSGETDYEIVPSDMGTINRLMWIVNAAGLPLNGSMEIPGELVLDNEPSQAETYVATVALTVVDPTDRSNYPQFPSWILDKYNNDICAGVLGRMMAQPAKPWTNERMGIFNTRKFMGGVALARSEAARKNVYRRQAWRFPSFA